MARSFIYQVMMSAADWKVGNQCETQWTFKLHKFKGCWNQINKLNKDFTLIIYEIFAWKQVGS